VGWGYEEYEKGIVFESILFFLFCLKFGEMKL